MPVHDYQERLACFVKSVHQRGFHDHGFHEFEFYEVEVKVHKVEFHEAERRSTIEVHPKVSEAPHLRSSIPHPKTDFRKKSKCLAAKNPMAQVYKKRKIEIKVDIPTIWDQGPPSFRKKTGKMCYLYRRTGLELYDIELNDIPIEHCCSAAAA